MNQACEMPIQNASGAEIQRILIRSKTIAVVGSSNNADRDSYRVAAYLHQHDF